MGSMQAMAMADEVEAGGTSLRAALTWHLRSNHYPPHPLFMVGVALRAVRKVEAGEIDARVRLPKGASHRRFGSLVPAWAIVDDLHLDAFISEGAE